MADHVTLMVRVTWSFIRFISSSPSIKSRSRKGGEGLIRSHIFGRIHTFIKCPPVSRGTQSSDARMKRRAHLAYDLQPARWHAAARSTLAARLCILLLRCNHLSSLILQQ